MFNQYGFRDIYEQEFPSCGIYAEAKLRLMSGKEIIKDLIKDILDSRAWLQQTKPLKTVEDAHGTLYRPARHHAKLAVNSAKTLADFLFETLAHNRVRRKP